MSGEAVFGADMPDYTWVYMPDGDIKVFVGDVRDPAKRYIGIVVKGGVTDDTAVVVYAGQIIIFPGGLSPGQVYYADPAVVGGMTKTKPSEDYQIVGVAIDEWRFLVAIQDFVTQEENYEYFDSDQEAFDAGYLVYKSGQAHESLPYGVKKEVDPRIS